jgi:flagellar protein FlaG
MQIDRVQGPTPPAGGPSAGTRSGSADAAAPAPEPAPAPATSQPAAAQGNQHALRAAVESVNRYLQSVNQSLRFERDTATGKTIVRIVDTASGDLVRQIPSEEVLDIARSLAQGRGVVLRTLA